MKQYIDKSALVAEIEKLYNGEIDTYTRNILDRLKSNIDTLEVKGVDLEKETDKWYNNEASKEFENVLYSDIEKCAKHFFELGLKASCSVDLTPDLDTLFEEEGIDPYSKEAKIFKEAICKAAEKYFVKAQKGEKI